MAIKLNEKTEVTVPIKMVVSLCAVIVSVAAFVFHIQERIDKIETTVDKKSGYWDSAAKFVTEFKPHPLVTDTAERVRLLELEIARQNRDIEHLKEKLNKQLK